jgi:hypothetical protein
MPLAARLFIVFLFILAVIGFWRFPRSDGPARSSIKFAVTADCPKKIALNMNDPCGARCRDLARVLKLICMSALPPKSGHSRVSSECPLTAKSGLA